MIGKHMLAHCLAADCVIPMLISRYIVLQVLLLPAATDGTNYSRSGEGCFAS